MEKLIQSNVLKLYHSAKQRILLLDYEGTLVGDNPDAGNNSKVDGVLTQLVGDNHNSVVVMSDWSPRDLSERIKEAKVTLVAESGGFVRAPDGLWQQLGDFYLQWKEPVSTAIHRLAHSYPNTTVDEKHFSIRWDYGSGISHLPESDQRQLKAAFRIMSSQYNVPMLETPNSIEFRAAGISKAKFVASWMNLHGPCDFILCIGDDKSDEEVFNLIGRDFITVRVGFDPTSTARYYIKESTEVLSLLETLAMTSSIK